MLRNYTATPINGETPQETGIDIACFLIDAEGEDYAVLHAYLLPQCMVLHPHIYDAETNLKDKVVRLRQDMGAIGKKLALQYEYPGAIIQAKEDRFARLIGGDKLQFMKEHEGYNYYFFSVKDA